MLSLIAAVVLMSGSADQIRRDSTYLEDGMSRAQVVAKLGNPDEVTLGVCGEMTPRPWHCYTWTYWVDGHHGALRILFHERDVSQYRDVGFVPDDRWGVVVWNVI